MKTVTPQSDWPVSWVESHHYDLMEIYGQHQLSRGYSEAYRGRQRTAIELVRKAASPGATVLDIAAAQGNFTLSLAELGYVVTWNDLRGELADYVRLKWERGSVEYAAGNAFELKFGDAFDVVLATEVIEHVAHPDQFLANLARLARPGGHVVVTTPNGGYFRNRLPTFSQCADPSIYEAGQFKPNADGHIFLLHLDEISRLADDAGLEIIEWRLYTNPLTNGSLGTAKLLPFVPNFIVKTAERVTQHLPLILRKKLNAGMALLLRRQGAGMRRAKPVQGSCVALTSGDR